MVEEASQDPSCALVARLRHTVLLRRIRVGVSSHHPLNLVLEQGLVTLDPLAPLTDIFTEEDGRQQDAPAEEQQQSKETSPEAADNNNNTSREEAPATGVAPAPASPSGAVGLSHESSSVGETA